MRNVIICAVHQMLLGQSNEIGEMKNTHIFWLESLRERHHSEYIDIDGRVKLRWILKISVRSSWAGFI
jgi:hypothetical protein